MPTVNGALMVVYADAADGLMVTTWLSSDLLRPEQRVLVDKLRDWKSGSIQLPDGTDLTPSRDAYKDLRVVPFTPPFML